MELAMSSAASKAAAAIVERFDATEKVLLATLHDHEEEVKKAADSRMEGAMVAIDPMTGAVRALVGGRDYYESNFNRSTQAFRPPGSTFKPVVYLAALAEGIERDHVIIDEPYSIGGFTPENYDRKFRGQVTLEEALLKSLNVPTVKLCAEIGVDKVCSMGKALGIETSLPYELSLSLGGCEV
jgi:penicillin-binding protein 1A